MIVMAFLHLALPHPVIIFTKIAGDANAFLCMLMIGVNIHLQMDSKSFRCLIKHIAVRYALSGVLAFLFYRCLPFSLEIRQAMAVIALAPSSSLALIFTMKLKGDVIMAGNICSLSILLSTIAMTILQRLRKPDPNGKPRRIKGGDWKYVIMFGLGGYVLSIGLQQYGTKLAGASLASLINCMNPIAICFFAVLLLHERMTMKKVVCIVSAVACGLHCRRRRRRRSYPRHSAFARFGADVECVERVHALILAEV